MAQPPAPGANEVVNHPLDDFKDEWHLSQQSVYSDNLIVLHDREPPDEIEFVYSTHHVLLLQLSHGTRQMIRMDGQEYDGVFPVGSIFLLPADCLGTFAWETTDEAVAFILTTDMLRQVAIQTECLDPERIELRPVMVEQDAQVEQLARAFCREMQTQGMGGRLFSESLANCLAIHLLRRYCTTPAQLRPREGGLSQYRLQQALDIIHASLNQSLSLESIAAELGLSVYYFSRLFRQSMGISPYQYVLQQRVAKAQTLLKSEELNITTIALECGFTDSSHLAHHFRKVVGVSPREYRQQQPQTARIYR